ncbi:MAG TPA: DUF5103 domain-containing protein [Algoriphagus sp.]|nr:DUF5103 domain-containing protein [Algoriphagus sp.]
MLNFFKYTLLLFCFISIHAFGQVEDKVYKDHIQSVRIFPVGAAFDSQLDASVISMSDSRPLMLFFDDLAYDPELYAAKLIHCDADWQPSQLKDNDFLPTFNEFNIQDFDYSNNTRVPFIHYYFQIPRVTKSGNYVVKVYANRDENNVVLTKRFMVYEELFAVGASIVPPSQTSQRRNSQQINLAVNYSKGEVMDPNSQVKVVIRQNQRWDNARFLTRPTFLNESSKTMRFESFDGENAFSAGNEFRFVDLRFIRATGVNVASVEVLDDIIYAEAQVDRPRPAEIYSQYLDLNGQYLVNTNDRPGGNPEIESEYMLTTFRLYHPQSSNPVYLLGALTNWGKNPEAKMQWNAEMRVYETTLLLKQGWYDYQYGYKDGNQFSTEAFEGAHFETENEYEVLIYFRNLGSRYDQLVGYVYLHPNRRRL